MSAGIAAASGTIEVLQPATLDELLDTLRLSNVRFWGDELPSRWVFRGQANSDWKLIPGIWRQNILDNYAESLREISSEIDSFLPKIRSNSEHNKLGSISDPGLVRYLSLRVLEQSLLKEFETLLGDGGFAEAVMRYDINWRENLNGGSILALDAFKYDTSSVALAQHAGLPTRFLDWTLDPIKALVFALNDDDGAQKIAVWAVDVNRLEVANSTSRNVYRTQFLRGRRYGNPYLHAQDGCFVFSEFVREHYIRHDRYPGIDEILDHDPAVAGAGNAVLRKVIFELTQDDKRDLTRRLYRDRKTLFHLMPSFERCARVAESAVKRQIR